MPERPASTHIFVGDAESKPYEVEGEVAEILGRLTAARAEGVACQLRRTKSRGGTDVWVYPEHVTAVGPPPSYGRPS